MDDEDWKVDLWVFTLPAHFMVVALWMVEIIVSNHVIHGANVSHLNKVNSIVQNNRIQSDLKAAVGLLESCEQVWHRWPLSGRYSVSIGSPSWFTSHNMKPCDEEKVSGHRCIAGVTMNIFSLRVKEKFGGRRWEGCVLPRNPRKKFQYQNPGSRWNGD